MNERKLINAENWTFTGYKSSNLMAFLHLGAEPTKNGPKVIYLVTVLKNEEEEVFQLEFDELAPAIDAINEKYHHWDFSDRGQKQSDGGCGSCSAH